MKDISFKVGRSRRFHRNFFILSPKGCEAEPPSIRVVEITVVVPEPDGRELCIIHEFASYDTDTEHFKDFIGHISARMKHYL